MTEITVTRTYDKTDLRQFITMRLKADSADYGLDIHFADYFARLTGRPETSVLSVVRSQADRNEKGMTGRNKTARAIRLACEQIWNWYNSASEYREIGTQVAIEMLESHDPAVIWAVLLGQKAQME